MNPCLENTKPQGKEIMKCDDLSCVKGTPLCQGPYPVTISSPAHRLGCHTLRLACFNDQTNATNYRDDRNTTLPPAQCTSTGPIDHSLASLGPKSTQIRRAQSQLAQDCSYFCLCRNKFRYIDLQVVGDQRWSPTITPEFSTAV